jgi:glutamine synthetase
MAIEESRMSSDVAGAFGRNAFNEATMRECLPKNVFKSLKKTFDGEQPLDPATADVIANAMKDWAIGKGATHFCHWFQPMTGLTAEKHDAFISPTRDGRTILEFSGKELTQGEPDASSFPSGGLRATFEARGYTAWDCTSPVFVKEDGKNITLYIPSAFCSYMGEALDKKTPLLRSMDALSRQAVRVLRALGNTTVKRVIATMGPEQEYFLVDQSFCAKRLDLVLAGRTLFGARPPRGQELEDHYFGSLHERVASFMNEVHNEVAPAQYELAPVFSTVNVAADHNQLTMDTLQKVARRHGFVCLLHEKPFAGVNGSGKHNNWSMATDEGVNLLDPGDTPHDNMIFLVMLCAVVRAVDKYATLLRASVANAGNDHRLGANEAPPAIVSVFLGEQLTDIFEQLAKGAAMSSKRGGTLKLGVSTLPHLPKDCTDRNRTSPFAFTGNKFEFRMVGSSQSISGPAFVLNTMVADALGEIADELEKAGDVTAAAQKVLQDIAVKHARIVFNGDNYCDEWTAEAARRGLPNIRSCVEALKTIPSQENFALFTKHGVLSEHELRARTEILFEVYSRQINVEALVMLSMARRQILPACCEYSARLGQAVAAVSAAGVAADTHKAMLQRVCDLIGVLQNRIEALDEARTRAAGTAGHEQQAQSYRDEVTPAMQALRTVADELETIVDARLWPLPAYAEMLFTR